MKSQTVTASRRKLTAIPYAFTEQGVAMLSSVLRSQRIEAMETRYDEQFSQVFEAIKQLITEDKTRKAKRPIGFL